jgi:hypothetical protein
VSALWKADGDRYPPNSALEALRLDPDPTVSRCVWPVGALGDDAFQTQLAGVLTETRAVASHMLVVPQPLDLLLEQPLEAFLALNEWQLCRALAIEKQKIEGEE